MDPEVYQRYLGAEDPEATETELLTGLRELDSHYAEFTDVLADVAERGLVAENIEDFYEALVAAHGEAMRTGSRVNEMLAPLWKNLLRWDDYEYAERLRYHSDPSDSGPVAAEELFEQLEAATLHRDLESVANTLSGYAAHGEAVRQQLNGLNETDQPAEQAILLALVHRSLTRQQSLLQDSFPDLRSFVFGLDSVYNLRA